MAEDNDDAIPYCIATGDIKKLVSFFTGRGQLRQALIIAQVQKKALIAQVLKDETTGNNRIFFYFYLICFFFSREPVRETSAHLKPTMSTI